MRPSRPSVALVVLVVLVGCTGAGTGPSPAAPATPTLTPAPMPTSTPASTLTSTPTATLSAGAAGKRAIAAEKTRIRDTTADWESLIDLSFGILRPAEYTVRSRNASGVVVAVTVGYSMEFECDIAVDGATTKTRYFVTVEKVRLVAVTQDVPDPSYCE